MNNTDRVNLLLVALRNIQSALSCCRQNEKNGNYSGCSECPFEIIMWGHRQCVLKHCDITTFALHLMAKYDNIRYPDRTSYTLDLKGGDKNDET